MVKTREENGYLYTLTDYSYPFIKKARSLNGNWTGSEWKFKLENKEYVLKALRDIFGEDGTNEIERVDMLIDLKKYVEAKYPNGIDDEIDIFNVSVVRRPARDSNVKMVNNCIVTNGNFESRGGSRANPRIGDIEGIELKLSNIPKSIVEKEIKQYKLDCITILEKPKAALGPKQVKTLIKYKIGTNEITEKYPIYEGERTLIYRNQIIISTEKEINSFINGDINDYELSESPFGIDSTEYFEVVDKIIE
ncbi:hypothetical protein U729_3189 (plasmid) [Clostridium baratii str. Sullivan]|uniref:Uncharacterized protein n=1 Tax=Clostridium baratii str. Sullivan TaxID=1415775 RepID=A0A0A7G2N2_9CLOT|nr:hypothetical protein [Clostridium baratii]AIY85276.1 hypothetical protein U729_3189 [Clostridium baratii str. Sullivan]